MGSLLSYLVPILNWLRLTCVTQTNCHHYPMLEESLLYELICLFLKEDTQDDKGDEYSEPNLDFYLSFAQL